MYVSTMLFVYHVVDIDDISNRCTVSEFVSKSESDGNGEIESIESNETSLGYKYSVSGQRKNDERCNGYIAEFDFIGNLK